MIQSQVQMIRVSLCNSTPIYVGNCLRYLISAESKDKLFTSFSYNTSEGLFIIDHEKTFARAAQKEQSSFNTCMSLPFEHGKNCPCYMMNTNPNTYSFQSTEIFVKLACSTVIIDSKNNILLTRRDKKLRSFPGAWVNPGGALDLGETLDQCALRELSEEVGLDIDNKGDIARGRARYYYAGRECEVKPFMVYESVYPTHIDQGFPKAQYLVIFYYIKMNCEHSKIKIKLQDQEIDKAVWINLPYLLESNETINVDSEMLNCYTVLPGGTQKLDLISSECFEGVYPNMVKEGIGEGHLIALKCYYNNYIKNSIK